ncbi:MAG TPA: hypothetical protein VNZ63_08390 [Verrucomicrobiae bacterium]|jgi:hypothetical protein|nr:hypothetical protein [Verrucomicrobiae bacterium]
MTSSVHSLQTSQSESQTEKTVQPPKNLQTEAAQQTAAPQDQVTISQEARQALASNTK